MFHDLRKITQQYLADLKGARPDLLPLVETLGMHFSQKYAGIRNKNHLHAKIDAAVYTVLAVLAAPTYEDAAEKIAQTRQIKPDGIGVIICEALSDALPHIASYAYTLRTYGFLHVRDHIFSAGKGFEKGGALDALYRAAAEKYPQVTEEALYRCLSSRKVTASDANPFARAALPYILLRLATAGEDAGAFQENSLTLGFDNETLVEEDTAHTESAIRALEVEYGLSIPGVEALNTAHTPAIKIHVPVYAPGATVNAIPAQRHGIQIADSPVTLEKQQLVQVLKDIISSRAYGINVQDGQIYLAYKRIPKKIVDPASQLTARFNLSHEKIEDAYNRVAAAIAEYMQLYADGGEAQLSTSINRAPSVQSSAARTARSG